MEGLSREKKPLWFFPSLRCSGLKTSVGRFSLSVKSWTSWEQPSLGGVSSGLCSRLSPAASSNSDQVICVYIKRLSWYMVQRNVNPSARTSGANPKSHEHTVQRSGLVSHHSAGCWAVCMGDEMLSVRAALAVCCSISRHLASINRVLWSSQQSCSHTPRQSLVTFVLLDIWSCTDGYGH